MKLAKRNGLRIGPRLRSRVSSRSFCIACGSMEPNSTGRRSRLLPSEEILRSCQTAGKDVPAGTMAMVSSTDFCARPKGPTAIATLNRQRHLTPSCGRCTPTAERTVAPARMIIGDLTPTPGIREQYRHQPDQPGRSVDVRVIRGRPEVAFSGARGPLLTPKPTSRTV